MALIGSLAGVRNCCAFIFWESHPYTSAAISETVRPFVAAIIRERAPPRPDPGRCSGVSAI